MKHWFPVLMAGLLCAASARANGLLIPADSSIPPLALVRHEVKTSLVEQVAQTEVTQVFRNHTSRVIDVKVDQRDLTELVELGEGEAFILHPGEFVLGSTSERVALPDDLTLFGIEMEGD